MSHTAIIKRSIVANEPWHEFIAHVVSIDGDKLTYTTDGIWNSTVTRGKSSDWSLNVKIPEVGERVRIFDIWDNVAGGGVVLDVDNLSVTVSQALVSYIDGEADHIEFPMRYSIANHTFEPVMADA